MVTQRLSLLISWLCTAVLFATPLAAAYLLVNIAAFGALSRNSIGLPVDWNSVVDWQWYALWAITFAYLTIGLAGFYYLRRAFANFARGEYFNAANSRDLQRFSILLFAQALAKPIHFSLASVLLSANHSAGDRMLSVAFGSNEIRMIAIAAILGVVSNLLVEGGKLRSENEQFV